MYPSTAIKQQFCPSKKKSLGPFATFSYLSLLISLLSVSYTLYLYHQTGSLEKESRMMYACVYTLIKRECRFLGAAGRWVNGSRAVFKFTMATLSKINSSGKKGSQRFSCGLDSVTPSSFLHMSRLLTRRVGLLPQRTAPRLIAARSTTVPIRALAMTTRTNPTAVANKRLNVMTNWLSAPKNQVKPWTPSSFSRRSLFSNKWISLPLPDVYHHVQRWSLFGKNFY